MRLPEDKVFTRLRLFQHYDDKKVGFRRVRMVQVVMIVPRGCFQCFADAFMICVPHYLNDGRN